MITPVPRLADTSTAVRRAFDLARRTPVRGPNPRVGCVLLAPPATAGESGRRVLAEGFHRGAGTPHAEVDALVAARQRGADVRGATAVVSLEPCNHTGRTGPCALALAEAGVAEVVYSVPDPTPRAAGGAAYLAARGVRVTGGVLRDEGEELLGAWWSAARAGRPYVTLKLAATLDGRVAAADGTSRWITGPEARAHAHEVRARVDAVAVGTGTVLADDPALTARTPDGLVPDQPLRVVVGRREVPATARLRGAGGELVVLGTHDVAEVLAALHAREVRHLLVEGGPVLATAFLAAGAVDELHAYVAPVLLGSGRSALGDLGVGTIADAARFTTSQVRRLGDDVLVVARTAGRPRTEEE
ncbi:bifunctional diaminohydroxyphosphoribosylaminopyrimidine deaminase/5-amino-6-(5-phosphoribosylamino)uracil reductase RibD [Cellulomonas sp. PhB143]|uniref:bifunctional diaminohydroxyphosphoribosylaminopyrimidine deaminase/5-amino-6-(5-phosphoribosylamino)uracil reductase RibD n=1 Tax=Cellulomonas sp. PhB143 TaxID=2485186 RepID=UPI000F4683AE|nr:bifunctional diaminohydroxyphosphoribosylaminopyrimidine deaminase/5-amino-6-(5-phosphoribosylamino)uracil reductase RibD [Cellulomonas sp. PhB143]ROS74517.1 diaminohydroxyphosphoribosylaminopyrimidine deaminase/5-amino-6-(5-phosphoribosylamino)uracil reductase [Cellulomonas sp. PhB143]